MTISDNPFLALKARLVLGAFLVIAVCLGLLLVFLGSVNLLPIQANDPILAPLLYMLIFSSLCLAILTVARHPSIKLVDLMGPVPRQLAWLQLLWLVVGLFLFSLGAFHISYLGLSLVAPSWVEATLQQSLLLSPENATSPRLYHTLMLFSVMVVAPITEEFIFRGVLLHRWGVKWGIQAAILLTSALFGLLHSNLIGLFIFGVVMSLLYLTTRSLLVPIVAHAMNNALASGLVFLTARSPQDVTVNTLVEFRASWWLGVVCLLISAPWVLRYVFYHWPKPQAPLPYFVNQAQRRHSSRR